MKWGSQISYGVCNRQAGNTEILPNRYLLPFPLDCAIFLCTFSHVKGALEAKLNFVWRYQTLSEQLIKSLPKWRFSTFDPPIF